MVRPLRIEYPGAVYHITSRGNKKESIFIDNQDRERFLSILNEVCHRYNWLCYAYCLMDNHYHLIIETVDGILSLGMRLLNGQYTQQFNKRHHKVGHVFQGRYKAILVQKETYLLELVRYVVLNPVRADIVTIPEGWKWSSFLSTIGMVEKPVFLADDFILSKFAVEPALAIQQFIKYVRDGIAVESPMISMRGRIMLGDDTFIKKAMRYSKGRKRFKEIAKNERFVDRPCLEDMFTDIRCRNERNIKIHNAHIKYGYKMIEIARHLKLHTSTVSKIFRNVRIAQQKNKPIPIIKPWIK